MKKLLDYDPQTGISHTFHYDETTDEARITSEQPVQSIVEVNKAQFNDSDKRFGNKQTFHKVASIPLSIYAELTRSGKINDQAYMKRWLNDPENRVFKTKNVTI